MAQLELPQPVEPAERGRESAGLQNHSPKSLNRYGLDLRNGHDRLERWQPEPLVCRNWALLPESCRGAAHPRRFSGTKTMATERNWGVTFNEFSAPRLPMASGSEPRSCCPLSPRLITRALAQSVAASAQHCTLSSTPSKHCACTLLGASPLTVSPISRTVATSEGFQYSTGSPPHTNDARNPGAWALSLKRTNAFNVVSRGHAISASKRSIWYTESSGVHSLRGEVQV